MASVNIHCPRCQSAQVYRHGQNPKGHDRFRCRDCHRVFQLTFFSSLTLMRPVSRALKRSTIHWVFMVSRSWYSQAVELLMCPTATLLSDVEPIENLVKTVRSGNTHAERISAMLTSPAMTETHDFSYRSVILTLSERKVLRLLGKGWGINQIASLLKKSNKTISAQKNSAMRRLAIHSNAEMYAWINSAQGARELNLPSVYGDAAEWNTAELRREMSHS
ncbi:Transcriptional regulator, LuxR family protein [Shigella dysenteriae 1617]|uniref:Transcriptional regulator, LuxR family protein n=1 Tax=Shigella dysenteriae 1617 TaxID=754093 RepID=A0A0A7A4F7_SHIDY|nr:Transcriptional regulator, LuxR family protein [Shigella dysenteriae 1617]